MPCKQKIPDYNHASKKNDITALINYIIHFLLLKLHHSKTSTDLLQWQMHIAKQTLENNTRHCLVFSATLTSTAENVLSTASGMSTKQSTVQQALHFSLSGQTSRRWSMICRKGYVKQTAALDKKSLSMYNALPLAIAYLAKQLLQNHTADPDHLP